MLSVSLLLLAGMVAGLEPCATEALFREDGLLAQVSPRPVGPVEGDTLRLFALGDWGVDLQQNLPQGEWRSNFDVEKRNLTAAAMQRHADASLGTDSPPLRMIVNLGDSFYTNGIRSTQDERWNTTLEHVFAEPEDVHWYSVLGNHDWYGNSEGQDEEGTKSQVRYTQANPFRKWCMPAYNYSFTATVHGKEDGGGDGFLVKFVFIDTQSMMLGGCRDPSSDSTPNREVSYCKGADVPVFSEQVAWLESETCGSSADWTVVVGHHPLVSAGYRISGYNPEVTEDWIAALDVSDDVKNVLRSEALYNPAYLNRTLHATLTRLLSRCGVNFYFAGHEHMTQLHTYTDPSSGHRLHQLAYGDSGKQNIKMMLTEDPDASACLISGQCYASDAAVKKAYGSGWEQLFKDNNGAFADVRFRKDAVLVDTISATGSAVHSVEFTKKSPASGDGGSGGSDFESAFYATCAALAVVFVVMLGAVWHSVRKGGSKHSSESTRETREDMPMCYGTSDFKV